MNWWLVAWLAPSHYMNQCWNIVISNLRNKLQWNLKRNSYIFIQENAFENVVRKMAAIMPDASNSSPPSATYIHQWTRSAGVQVMACRLSGAKPLPEPMLIYCQLDPQEQTSMKSESKYKIFRSRKCIWKCCQQNGNHFVSVSMH